MRPLWLCGLVLGSALLLSGCDQFGFGPIVVKPPPAAQPGPPVQYDAGYPAAVKAELDDWYRRLPSALISGANNVSVVFTAADGHVYPTRAALKFKQGQIKTLQQNRVVTYEDGTAGPTLPPSEPVQELGKLDYTCNSSNGPYYRSWTRTGYAGVYSVLSFDQTPQLSAIQGKTTAAYVYLGAQSQNRDVDVGLVYLNGSLRLFVTDPSAPDIDPGVVEQYWEVSPPLGIGQGYPLHLQVDGDGGYILRMDTPGGTILANRIARQTGTNYLGQGLYFKRNVSVASAGLSSYNGTQKYPVQHQGSHRDSRVLVYRDGDVSYQPYSSANLHSGGCRWPNSTIVQVPSGGAPQDQVAVSIDLNR